MSQKLLGEETGDAKRPRNFREWLLVTAMVSLVYTNGLAGMYIHADESSWISSSNLFDEYIHGHFSSPVWSEDYNRKAGTSVLFNSTVTRFIIGIGRSIGGIGPEALNAPYDFALTREENTAKGMMPSPDLLWWSRIVISLLSAAGIAIGFYIIKDIAGPVGGYVWLTLSLTSTYFLFSLRTALDEGPLVFGCVLLTWSIAKFLKFTSGTRGTIGNTGYLFRLVLMGIVVGLSAGAKLNGAILILPCLMAVLLVVYRAKVALRQQIVTGLLSGIMIIGSAYLAFLAPNPYLWRNPIVGPTKMIETRVQTITSQFNGYPDLRIPSGWPHVQFVVKRIYSTFSPLNVSPFQGWYLPPSSVDAPFIAVNLMLTVIGFIYCARQSREYLSTGEGRGASAAAIVLVGICASAPGCVINLDQPRYYVIPIYFSTMLLGIAIDRIAKSSRAEGVSRSSGNR